MRRSRLNPVSDRRRAQLDALGLPPTATMRRETPLAPTSARRRAQNAVRFTETNEAVLRRSGGRCEAASAIAQVDFDSRRCRGRMDMHEVVTRARGGSITDPANVLLACRRHHDWIGDHPKLAAEVGLLKWSWERDR